MNTLSRQEKLARFQTLTKVNGVTTGRAFEESRSTVARLLIDHPHAYREWRIVGPASERGFYHLESSVRLDQFETTKFTLCLHETEFERL